MSTRQEILDRSRAGAKRATHLLQRVEGLSTRLEKLAPDAPAAAGNDAVALDIDAILRQVEESGLQLITDELNGELAQLDEVADSVAALMDRISDLPDELIARSIDQLDEFMSTMDGELEQMITTVQTAFSETADKVNQTIEDTQARIETLATTARETIETALTDLQETLEQSRRDVEQIISTLERTRETVFTICRTVGIGASSAEPAIEVAVSSFSAVG